MSLPPPIRYIRSKHGDIACRVMGDGPSSLMLVNPMSRNVEMLWDYPPWAALLGRLAQGRRLIVFDRRGCGISDPLPANTAPTWEDWLADMLIVLDELEVREVSLLAERDAAAASMLFAGSRPERVRALILCNTSARFRVAPDYPCGESDARTDGLCDMWHDMWSSEGMVTRTRELLTADPAYLQWVMRMQRVSYSPRRAGAEFRYIINFDARTVLPAIHAPTLILHRRDFAVIPPAHAQYLAAHIEGAQLEILPGSDMDVLVPGDAHTLGLIDGFLAGLGPARCQGRALTTLVWLDIPQASQLAANLGEARWQDLLVRQRAIVRAELARFEGHEGWRSEAGFLVSFDGPARAMRFARAVRQALRDHLRLEIRASVHTGECTRVDDRLTGPAVELGSAVLQAAQAGEVLATSAVKDLGVGSGIELRDLGRQTLRGIAGSQDLYALAD